MAIKSKRKLLALNKRLMLKAMQNVTSYHVVAAAYTKRGDLLGIAANTANTAYTPSRRGGGIHAERALIIKYGKRIKYVVLSRTGKSGNTLPIHPCDTCQKLLDRYGIIVVLMHPLLTGE